MSSTRNKLIELLAKNVNTFISGQILSEQLNVSRNTIWKHMNQLKKDGYEIEGVANKGYKIISFPNKISENTIKWGLHTNWLGKKIIHRESLDTTQKLAHQLALEGAKHGTVVIADEQTDGKGRVNRYFHSKKEKGIWMSLILRPNILPYMAPQLTLLTATVLADVISEETEIKPQIKWPNDVLINEKKISGILTEMQAEQDKVVYVIVGIGINVNHKKNELYKDTRNEITSLNIETNQEWDLNKLTQKLLRKFELKYDQYMQNGFANVKTDWESYGFKLNEPLFISSGNHQFSATFIGIAEDGALLAKKNNGEIERIYAGEISWF